MHTSHKATYNYYIVKYWTWLINKTATTVCQKQTCVKGNCFLYIRNIASMSDPNGDERNIGFQYQKYEASVRGK